jgi:hypothetical protein
MLTQTFLSSPLSYSDIAICEIIAPSSRGSIVTFYSQASSYHCCHLAYIPYNPLTLELRFRYFRERRPTPTPTPTHTHKRNINKCKPETLNCLIQNLNSTTATTDPSVTSLKLNMLEALQDTLHHLNDRLPTFRETLLEGYLLAFRRVLVL